MPKDVEKPAGLSDWVSLFCAPHVYPSGVRDQAERDTEPGVNDTVREIVFLSHDGCWAMRRECMVTSCGVMYDDSLPDCV